MGPPTQGSRCARLPSQSTRDATQIHHSSRRSALIKRRRGFDGCRTPVRTAGFAASADICMGMYARGRSGARWANFDDACHPRSPTVVRSPTHHALLYTRTGTGELLQISDHRLWCAEHHGVCTGWSARPRTLHAPLPLLGALQLELPTHALSLCSLTLVLVACYRSLLTFLPFTLPSLAQPLSSSQAGLVKTTPTLLSLPPDLVRPHHAPTLVPRGPAAPRRLRLGRWRAHRQHERVQRHLGAFPLSRPPIRDSYLACKLRPADKVPAKQSDADKFDGDYYVRNVKTGKYLYFDRSNDKTNLITGDDKNTIQLGQDKQYGQSGRKWETWHGTYLRGGNDKCMSAQWGEHGTDVAGVSYACKVGPGSTGSDSLETGKQFWKVVPCGGDGGSSDSAATADFKHLNVESKSDSAQGDDSGSSSSNGSSSPSPSASSDNQPKATQSTAIDPKDRSTWVCHKDGKWLAEHPECVAV